MGTTIFVWDPVFDCVTHELDENNNVKAEYHNEPRQYGGVLSQRRGTTTHYHHHDALGSTRFLTDSSGNVSDTYLHDAWGNLVASTGTTINPFKWVGKYGYYTDNSTAQVCVRARMYQPISARWLSVDPLLRSMNVNPRNSDLQIVSEWHVITNAAERKTAESNGLLTATYVMRGTVSAIDPSGLREFSTLWSRGGDDEPRTYETALIAIDVLSHEAECVQGYPGCFGDVKFKLHYHAQVHGAFKSPTFGFGLCVGTPGQFTILKGLNHKPPRREPGGYITWHEVFATIDLESIPCCGGRRKTKVWVSQKQWCDDNSVSRVAEEIDVDTFVEACGNALANIEAIEFATGAGYPHPLRCVSCGEARYPAAENPYLPK